MRGTERRVRAKPEQGRKGKQGKGTATPPPGLPPHLTLAHALVLSGLVLSSPRALLYSRVRSATSASPRLDRLGHSHRLYPHTFCSAHTTHLSSNLSSLHIFLSLFHSIFTPPSSPPLHPSPPLFALSSFVLLHRQIHRPFPSHSISPFFNQTFLCPRASLDILQGPPIGESAQCNELRPPPHTLDTPFLPPSRISPSRTTSLPRSISSTPTHTLSLARTRLRLLAVSQALTRAPRPPILTRPPFALYA